MKKKKLLSVSLLSLMLLTSCFSTRGSFEKYSKIVEEEVFRTELDKEISSTIDELCVDSRATSDWVYNMYYYNSVKSQIVYKESNNKVKEEITTEEEVEYKLDRENQIMPLKGWSTEETKTATGSLKETEEYDVAYQIEDGKVYQVDEITKIKLIDENAEPSFEGIEIDYVHSLNDITSYHFINEFENMDAKYYQDKTLFTFTGSVYSDEDENNIYELERINQVLLTPTRIYLAVEEKESITMTTENGDKFYFTKYYYMKYEYNFKDLNIKRKDLSKYDEMISLIG